MRPYDLPSIAAAAAVLALSGCSADARNTATAPGQEPTTASPAGAGAGRRVSAQEGLALAAQPGTVVLDVRTAEEYGAGHLDGARSLPLADDFERRATALSRAARYVLYCASGNRSAQATAILTRLGFTHVADAGGLSALADAGGRVVR